MKNKQIIIGSILCMIASVSWGAMFPVAHIALQQVDPFYFSFLRYFFVTVILCGLLWVKEGLSAFRFEGRGRALVFFGTMAFTVYNMGVFLGQHLMGEAGIIAASIMEVLMPMISILLLSVTTKKLPPSYTLTSIAIALAGALLVITNGNLAFFTTASEQLFPLLLIFAGVIGWVIYSIGGGHFSSWSTLRYSTLTCLLGTAVSFVVIAIASLFQWIPVPTWESVVSIKYEMAFMVLLPGLAALLSWNAGIKALTPLNGILFINLVPVTTFILMSFQGYEISMFEFYGTLLVIFALIRNNHFQRKQLGYRVAARETGRRKIPSV
ncbi:transporter [Brevibacillus choshinensis]|uniref:Transporter n=1 Tax=Brevibacillus choshinensis TaxID=54911 RepID=A0ABR5NDZ8_BRECH|nr:DMT family transporter [Brevibacillus choshinensis]KQL49776.1 transporter [Brevibacillus choshinensis]